MTPLIPALAWFAGISVALAVIDLRTRRLPNAIVLPSYPVLAALLALASWLLGDWAALLRSLAGAAILLAGYGLVAVAAPRGMGLGDVKLAGLIGLVTGWIGWGALAVAAVAGVVAGGLAGLALVLAGRAGRRSSIAFGPWMLLGAWTGILVGEAIAGWYLGGIGLR